MNASNLLEIIFVGKNIINDIESTDDKYKSLLVLIHLESILDKGRTILNPSDLDKLPEINKGVDEIRLKIVELMKSLDKKEIQNMLSFESEQVKTNFISSL
jgi:hypothetical protein